MTLSLVWLYQFLTTGESIVAGAGDSMSSVTGYEFCYCRIPGALPRGLARGPTGPHGADGISESLPLQANLLSFL
jgi:hypothetical protein